MTFDQYLGVALAAQAVSDAEIDALRRHRDDVERLLRDGLGPAARIRYGGSYAKDTMIKDSFDLDILCYFPHEYVDAGATVGEIFRSVRDTLAKAYALVTKRCALRIHNIDQTQSNRDYHVDVVPGRFVDADKDSTWLHVTTPDKERLKTSIEKHINHVQSSGRHREIRLAKLWNLRKGLGVPTFVLELLVVKALKEKTTGALGASMTSFWTYVQETDPLIVHDPANPAGNDLSDLLDANTQGRMKQAAKDALAAIEANDWPRILGPVDEKKAEARIKSAAAGVSIAKPWSE